MNTEQSPARRGTTRRKLHGRLRGIAVLVVSFLLLLPFAGPVQARIGEPVRNDPVGTSDETDIVITSLGFGEAVNGAIPPVGATWPIDSYPTTRPAGYETENVDFAGIIETQDAQGTTTAQMYCIDLRTSTRIGIGYVNGTWSEANVPNIGYVERILNTYYPSSNLPAGLNNNQRAAAVQAAIWFFTDGYVVNPRSPLYSAVAGIVNATIAAGPQTEPPAPDISVTPATAEASVNDVAGPYTVEGQEGADITVTVSDGFTLYADAAGTVPLDNPVESGTQVWVRSDAGDTG
ncbi:MAG: thioester domain-containing protein, partial [Arthrobacter sp.]